MALGQTSPSLLRCLLKRTEELLFDFSFPLLTLQLNSLTRLLQLNSTLLQHPQQQQQQQQQQQLDMHAMAHLWRGIVSRLSSALPQDAAAAAAAAASTSAANARLRDLLHDHLLAAQEAYDAAMQQQQQQQQQQQLQQETQRRSSCVQQPGHGALVPQPGGGAPPSLPPVQPHELKNVVNALNSFARLSHLGLVSLRDVAADTSAAAAVAAAAAAAATDPMRLPPPCDSTPPKRASKKQQQQQQEQEQETAAAAADELRRWRRSRERLSSLVECIGSFRMRGVELGPGDRRTSSSIYGFFHQSILLLIKEQGHLGPQSLSNAVNAFAKARLQG